MVDCYVGIGGNFTNTLSVMRRAITQLKGADGISALQVSRLYRTTPVSDIPQPDFLNAACRFQTQLTIEAVWEILRSLEKTLGQKPKPKNSPRLIDLDLLFYGSLVSSTQNWTVPHPRWHERLFVLTPLADITEKLPTGNVRIKDLLKEFSNPHNETVHLMQESLVDA